ncbi:DUF6434 domain-containing protein [Xanthomonas sp. D-109]|uniref:DUF6434 domain-containing protein n=1 Tax=Xanthomonas sp. D-109 TaxID=2821274 RepID=UPI001FD202FD|nr:DUF6434 domain-containing protein [Xanthomonas sp. D-109]
MLGPFRACSTIARRATKDKTATGAHDRQGNEMSFDWHNGPITRATPVDRTYRNTQAVRRFLSDTCGAEFKFDRGFMAWIKDGVPKSMGEVADEWLRRRRQRPEAAR